MGKGAVKPFKGVDGGVLKLRSGIEGMLSA
jgi:hypothetical protein